MGFDVSGFVHMGAWMKYKYAQGNWINDIPVISGSGTFTLNPLTSPENNAYKILSPYSNTEFFIVEYRNGEGFYESNLPGADCLFTASILYMTEMRTVLLTKYIFTVPMEPQLPTARLIARISALMLAEQ